MRISVVRVRGLIRCMHLNPSTEVLGYCQSSRIAGLYSDSLVQSGHPELPSSCLSKLLLLSFTVLAPHIDNYSYSNNQLPETPVNSTHLKNNSC